MKDLGQVLGLQRIKSFSLSKLLSLNTITAFFCVSAIVLALIEVPNNYDGMSYHLPRIVHWLQNGSVAHYACHDISQISNPYLAEFVNLQVYALSDNSDMYLNLLQTFSYILTVMLVYKLSVKIGCNSLWASLAGLVYSMSSTVFGEALNVQVDLFAGIWLMFFIYLSLWFIESERLEWSREAFARILLMGLICGFAYTAKISVLFGILTFAVWLLIRCLARKDKIQHIIFCAAGIIVPAAIIILPELARNIVTFGSFAAEESSTHFLLPVFTPRYFLFNLLTNVIYNLPGIPADIKPALDNIVQNARNALFPGQDIPEGLRNFRFPKSVHSMNHDSSLNSVVMWLFMLACILVLGACIYCMVRKIKNPLLESRLAWYWVPAFSGFVLFLGFVSWYLFINRYEVSYYSMILPGIAFVLQKVFSGRTGRYAGYAVIALSVSTVLYNGNLMYNYKINHIRQGRTRTEEYFRYRDMSKEYEQLTDYINDNGFTQLGFLCGKSSYEYPFWTMTEKPGRRVEHVNVTNETARYADTDFQPECIFATDVKHKKRFKCNGTMFKMLMETEHTALYVPA